MSYGVRSKPPSGDSCLINYHTLGLVYGSAVHLRRQAILATNFAVGEQPSAVYGRSGFILDLLAEKESRRTIGSDTCDCDSIFIVEALEK